MKHANPIKGPNSRTRAVADRSAARSHGGGQATLLTDNRSESVQLKKMQLMADNSPQALGAVQLQAMADRSPYAVAQRKLLEVAPSLIQRQGDEEDLQMKAAPSPIQRQGDEEEPMLKAAPVQKKENNTGMPNRLKSGVESLSGISMDDVKVHYSSDKPATLQALAYTQGTDIHVGPGQEKHLAHEAWHVAQQKQGRVRPTVRMAGAQVNDDVGLEHEADVMGSKALQLRPQVGESRGAETRPDPDPVAQKTTRRDPGDPIQAMTIRGGVKAASTVSGVTHKKHVVATGDQAATAKANYGPMTFVTTDGALTTAIDSDNHDC